jgi:hypothetical protein
MDWAGKDTPSSFCLSRLPEPNGFPDPTVRHPYPRRLALMVPPGPRVEYPPDRRVAPYVDDDEHPMGYCNGTRLVPSKAPLSRLEEHYKRWDLSDVELELDPPDLLERIEARMNDLGPSEPTFELHCSPDVCHGLVDELISRLPIFLGREVSLRTPSSLFADLEAGRIR